MKRRTSDRDLPRDQRTKDGSGGTSRTDLRRSREETLKKTTEKVKTKITTDPPLVVDEMGGTRGDGNFYLSILPVGQGDCTIMMSPQGRFIMIDCGTTATDGTGTKSLEECREILGQPRFMLNHQRVHALIMTHPDKDHYCWIPAIFEETAAVYESVYHSQELSSYACDHGVNMMKHLRERGASARRVQHCLDRNGDPVRTLRGRPIPQDDRKGNLGEPAFMVGDVIRILDEEHCKVDILAAGVTRSRDDDGADPDNIGSIVTLITAFSERILIVGDATFSTEDYLMNHHRAKIQDLELIQVGHHGSEVTSSQERYIALTNPNTAVICAAATSGKNHLPSMDVVMNWEISMRRLRNRVVDDHPVPCWSAGSNRSYPTNQPIWSTGTTVHHHATDAPNKAGK
ncbi:hypothetical protein GCM10022221_66340 [Actinocorallia aurea]